MVRSYWFECLAQGSETHACLAVVTDPKSAKVKHESIWQIIETVSDFDPHRLSSKLDAVLSSFPAGVAKPKAKAKPISRHNTLSLKSDLYVA